LIPPGATQILALGHGDKKFEGTRSRVFIFAGDPKKSTP
jgi:hypothetical protein